MKKGAEPSDFAPFVVGLFMLLILHFRSERYSSAPSEIRSERRNLDQVIMYVPNGT